MNYDRQKGFPTIAEPGAIRHIAGELGEKLRVAPETLLIGHDGHLGHLELLGDTVVLIVAPAYDLCT